MENSKMTVQEIDTQIAHHVQASHESWERSDTDGFLTQWAHDLEASRLRREREIVENGGTATFVGLYTVEGERVPARLVTLPHPRGWGEQEVWELTAQAASVLGRKYIPTGTKSRVQKQLGLQECPEVAPAEAVIDGVGRGLSGRCWVATRRTGDEWGRDAVRV